MIDWGTGCRIVLLVLFIICVVWLIKDIDKHYCDNPYEQICVKSHNHTTMRFVSYHFGGITTTRPVPMVVKVCEKYEPRLKERCKGSVK